ncbi:MAG TPA: AMIN domain-containing protein, partial [Myxococcaceae bacterium]|nr:AMIN domain-containing protein [Myxococcaceae bacterium]
MRSATSVVATMKALGLVLTVAMSVPAAGAQGKAELNRVTRVQIRGEAVEITAARPPSFTTFNLADPPRLVIDVAEAVFAGVPGTISGAGPISGIKTVSYGSGSAAIARLVIGLERELETDIESKGNVLVVRVLGGGSAPVVAMGDADRAAQEKKAAEATRRAEEERAAQEKAAREASERAEAERRARAESEKAAREEAARQAEAQKKAAAEAARRAEEERAQREKAERERIANEKAEQQRAEREKAAREKAEREQAAREKAEQARRDAEARGQAEEAARREARERAEQERKAREESGQKARDERIAQQKAEREAVEHARRESEERRKREQEASRQAEAERRKRAQEVSAQAEAERRAREQERREAARAAGSTRVASAPGAGDPQRTVALVGFRPEGHTSRVFIRTDAPAQFEIREADETTIVVALPNTRIGSSNNARFLDTSFFD